VAAFASALVLTLANPMTILAFTGLVAALAGGAAAPPAAAPILVAGVFLGSAAWWLVLVTGVTAARRALSGPARRAIGLASGGLILAFGLGALAGGLGLR
jgi:threonine/homoserine/homoserine lactone efflux protein